MQESTAQATDLANDILVGEANNHPVLGGVVLVFVLDDQAFAGIVVSLTLWNKQARECSD